jgi:hypothetical protein
VDHLRLSVLVMLVGSTAAAHPPSAPDWILDPPHLPAVPDCAHTTRCDGKPIDQTQLVVDEGSDDGVGADWTATLIEGDVRLHILRVDPDATTLDASGLAPPQRGRLHVYLQPRQPVRANLMTIETRDGRELLWVDRGAVNGVTPSWSAQVEGHPQIRVLVLGVNERGTHLELPGGEPVDDSWHILLSAP